MPSRRASLFAALVGLFVLGGCLDTLAPRAESDASRASTAKTTTDWVSRFEGGDFSEWDWYGQDDPKYTGLSVVDPGAEGLPALRGRAARFALTEPDVAAGRTNAKVYKFFRPGAGGRTTSRPTPATGV